MEKIFFCVYFVLSVSCRYLQWSKVNCQATAYIDLRNIDIIHLRKLSLIDCASVLNFETVYRFKNAICKALTSNWFKLKFLYDSMVLM